MKVVTSVTLHTTSEGQRISYTYSEVDENSGTVLRDNVRESLIVMDIEANKEALQSISAIKEYVTKRL